MTFLHGKGTRIMVAQYDISTYFSGADVDSSVSSHDVTTLGKNTVQRAAGLTDGKASLSGLFDATADALLAGWLGAATGQAFTICPGGDSAGGPAQIGKTQLVSYKASEPVGGMVAASVSVECKTDWEAKAKVLHILGAETETGFEASVNNGASSANGGLATLHVTTASAADTLDVKIQHSANDTDWADLTPAFTQVAAATSEVIAVAAGTTVNQYLREYHTIAGTEPSFTYLVAFARR